MEESGSIVAREVPRATDVANFVRLEHTLFSLPLLFAGALLAERAWPSARTSLLIVAAGTGARTAALALNRIIDRRIDAANPRTRVRELPAGRLKIGQAWGVCLAGIALYLVSAAMLGRLTLLLSPIPLIVFTCYPYLKRFTTLAHFGVGLGLALAPLGAWVAVTQRVWPDLSIGLLTLFTLLWVAGFDIIYATLDIEFDRSHGLHSIPARLGSKALLIAALLHLIALLCLLALAMTSLDGLYRYYALAAVGLLFAVEHFFSRKVNFAFFHVNSVLGFFVLLFIMAGVQR